MLEICQHDSLDLCFKKEKKRSWQLSAQTVL